ncbi:MAG: flavodoxin family protein [Candidatus Hermodarchaeota archaeon]
MEKNILIVYYSLTGNTKYMAECIQEAIGGDIQSIKPIKELNPKGGMKFLWGGMQATMKKKPELEPIEKVPTNYDVIIIGTPVWAWTYSPPIRTFLSEYDLSGKDIAIWCCSGGGPGKTLEKLEASIENSNMLGKIHFKEPLKNNPEEAKQQISEWAKNLLN